MIMVAIEQDPSFGTAPPRCQRTSARGRSTPATGAVRPLIQTCQNCGSGSIGPTSLRFPRPGTSSLATSASRSACVGPRATSTAARLISSTSMSGALPGADGPRGRRRRDTVEPTVQLGFFDEDENTVSQGVCPSPCSTPQFNFPLETQQTNITKFSHPTGARRPAGSSWTSAAAALSIRPGWATHSRARSLSSPS